MQVELGQVKLEMQVELGLVKIMGYLGLCILCYN